MKNGAEKQEIIGELEKFYEDLRTYKNRQSRRHNSKFSAAQIRSLDALRLKLQRDHGRLLNIISEHGGSAHIRYLNRDYEVFSYSLGSLDMPTRGLAALDRAISVVNRVIGKLQSLALLENSHVQVPEDSAQMANFLFDRLQLHPKVVEASRELFKDGHYRDAIYRAFVEVVNFVKHKAKSQLDGKRLMSTVFSPDNPEIRLNPLETQTDKDEQEGFMYLFMGAVQGIRNPKAHENIIQNNPYIALQLIGFASLLIQTIAFWKAEDT